MCPYTDISGKCSQKWPFFLVRRLAHLSKKEVILFESALCENFIRKALCIQECPRCHSLCDRKKTEDSRVVCPLCSRNGRRYEFCWWCLNTWKGSVICGNGDCPGENHRKRILRDAPKKTINCVANCPSRRACPACGRLIEHVEACSQIICPCGQTFCFICLTKADVNGRYLYGTHAACSVAEIQDIP